MLRHASLAALGAVIGSLGRYGIALLIPHHTSESFPWAPFLVNVLGALIIGMISQRSAIMENDARRHFVVTGVLGGFTTFSALAVEAVQLSARPAMFFIYVCATFGVGLAATHIGRKVAFR